MLLISVSLCTAIELSQTRKSILDISYRQTEEKQQALIKSFTEMVQYYISADDSEAAQKALIHYCFSRFADPSSILIWRGERLYGQTDPVPDEYLYIDPDNSAYEAEIDGQRLLIAGGRNGFSFLSGKFLSGVCDGRYGPCI